MTHSSKTTKLHLKQLPWYQFRRRKEKSKRNSAVLKNNIVGYLKWILMFSYNVYREIKKQKKRKFDMKCLQFNGKKLR